MLKFVIAEHTFKKIAYLCSSIQTLIFMDYEKRYKEIVAEIEEILDNTSEDYLCTHLTKDDIREMYARFFPELRQREEERMREWLFGTVDCLLGTIECPFNKDKVLELINKPRSIDNIEEIINKMCEERASASGTTLSEMSFYKKGLLKMYNYLFDNKKI